MNGQTGDVVLAETVVRTATSRAFTDADDVVIATADSITLTLHSAVTAKVKTYTLTNESSGSISFATTSSQTVNGSTTGTITAGQSISVVPTASNWTIV